MMSNRLYSCGSGRYSPNYRNRVVRFGGWLHGNPGVYVLLISLVVIGAVMLVVKPH